MISTFIRSPIGIFSSFLFLIGIGLCLMPGCGTVPPTPVLYVTNTVTSSVVSFPNPATTTGNTAPATNVSGAATLINTPQGVVVLSNDDLVVCNWGPPAITVYANARTATGNLAPSRIVQGSATQLAIPTSLAYDSTRDLLYVGNLGTNQILVFTGVSTSSFNGNVAPARVIGTTTGTPISAPMGLFIDTASDTLYVANHVGNNVLVYSAASTLNSSNVSPARVINCLSFVAPMDLVVDSGNNLIVTQIGGPVLTFTSASTRTGTIPADFSFTIAGAFLSEIAVDAAGNGYLSDQSANAVYSINNIATRTGVITPDRTIQGAATQLSGAYGIFLSQ
jgi:hypothetical protein